MAMNYSKRNVENNIDFEGDHDILKLSLSGLDTSPATSSSHPNKGHLILLVRTLLESRPYFFLE